MQTIKPVTVKDADGKESLGPATEFPEDTVRVVFANGIFTVYQKGDTLPKESK